VELATKNKDGDQIALGKTYNWQQFKDL